MRIAVAVSGGVDSLAALLLMKMAGYDVLALHGLFLDRQPDRLDSLEAICVALSIPLHVADLRAPFRREVMEPFVNEYGAGLTPNPCARCNAAIKFGALADVARSLGCRAMASGHYAAKGAAGPRISLNPDKDQSYFLALVPSGRLAMAEFPLANMASKEETRTLVAAAGFTPPIQEESQDVCFLGRRGLAEFLCAEGVSSQPGPVLLRESCGREVEIGRHAGLWRHTVGQRRGLGIAWHEPLHVLEKRQAGNSLVLGGRAMLGMSRILTRCANFFSPPGAWPGRTLLRVRHRGPLLPAGVIPLGGGRLEIRLPQKAFPTAPGQIAAIYSMAGELLAGAVIDEVL